jgi:hypothetical protein
MLCVVLEMAAGELDRLYERITGRFAREEPRARVLRYVSGLVAGLERKNGWTLAEQDGELNPDGMQRLVRRADWDVDGVRDASWPRSPCSSHRVPATPGPGGRPCH